MNMRSLQILEQKKIEAAFQLVMFLMFTVTRWTRFGFLTMLRAMFEKVRLGFFNYTD